MYVVYCGQMISLELRALCATITYMVYMQENTLLSRPISLSFHNSTYLLPNKSLAPTRFNDLLHTKTKCLVHTYSGVVAQMI